MRKKLELLCTGCGTPTMLIAFTNNGYITCPHCNTILRDDMVYIIDTDDLALYCEPDEDHVWGREFVFEMKSGYCGKILELQLSGVASTIHHHNETDETLVVLSGKVEVWINHPPFQVYVPGQIINIKRGENHQFMAHQGPALILRLAIEKTLKMM